VTITIVGQKLKGPLSILRECPLPLRTWVGMVHVSPDVVSRVHVTCIPLHPCGRAPCSACMPNVDPPAPTSSTTSCVKWCCAEESKQKCLLQECRESGGGAGHYGGCVCVWPLCSQQDQPIDGCSTGSTLLTVCRVFPQFLVVILTSSELTFPFDTVCQQRGS
jgi:hypothetical protein